MPNTPYTGMEDGTLRVTITLDGSAMNSLYGIQSIQVDHALNKISTAEIVLRGEMELDSGSFPISDGSDFNPGVKIVVSAGYGESETATIFTGLIVKHIVELTLENFYMLRIICKHESVKLTYQRKDGYFSKQKDSDIISSIFSDYGISPTVGATS
ncbi:MAG TPA: hypothetical protein VKH37_05580, partial [Ferruginibacter sp.]|nr:hypothetical protein [Ferruginibacter sp.]